MRQVPRVGRRAGAAGQRGGHGHPARPGPRPVQRHVLGHPHRPGPRRRPQVQGVGPAAVDRAVVVRAEGHRRAPHLPPPRPQAHPHRPRPPRLRHQGRPRRAGEAVRRHRDGGRGRGPQADARRLGRLLGAAAARARGRAGLAPAPVHPSLLVLVLLLRAGPAHLGPPAARTRPCDAQSRVAAARAPAARAGSADSPRRALPPPPPPPASTQCAWARRAARPRASDGGGGVGQEAEEPGPAVVAQRRAEGLLAEDGRALDVRAPHAQDLGHGEGGDADHGQAAVPLLRGARDPKLPGVAWQVVALVLVEVQALAHPQGRLLQGRQGEVRQGGDEERVAVERRHALEVGDARLVGDLPVLLVDLLERLHVLRHEAQRDHHQVLEAGGAELLEDDVGVGLEPLDRADPTLEGEDVVELVGAAVDLVHDELRALFDLGLVRVARLHVALGHAVGGEHDLDLAGPAGELGQLLADELRLAGEVARVVEVVRDDGVVDLARVPPLQILLHDLVEQADGASGCGDGVLWVHGQDYQPVHIVHQESVDSLLGEGVPVTHPDVNLALDTPLAQLCFKTISLLLSQLANGRTTTDGLVISTRIRCSSPGDTPSNERLKGLDDIRKTDNVRIVEKIKQKILYFAQLFWPS
mmetsp:Transcript_22805/g.47877  ORF Transcript_22805/g.47877 Transcript_22805/m.47877 type:complete len:640 (-) Transcript_22805:358-2277(-)